MRGFSFHIKEQNQQIYCVPVGSLMLIALIKNNFEARMC